MSKKLTFRKVTKGLGAVQTSDSIGKKLNNDTDISRHLNKLTKKVNTISKSGESESYKGTAGDIKINKIGSNRYDFYIRGEDGWHKDNNSSFGPIDENKDAGDPPTINMTSGQIDYGYEGNNRLTLNLDPTKISTASVATPSVKAWGNLKLESTGHVILSPTNNVGIGTTSPDYPLDVTSSSQIGVEVESSFSGPSGVRVKRASGDSVSLLANYSGFGGGLSSTDALRFTVNDADANSISSPAMYIETDGNVGIGTDSPAETLEVVGDFAVRGSELIDNPTFTSDLSDWTLSSDTPPTYVSGNMQMNSDGATFSTARQSFTTVVGVTYVASGNITVHGSSNKIEIGTSAGASDNLNYTTTGTGTFTQTFTATATTTHIEVQDGGGGTGNTYSEVSVRQIATIYTDKTNNRVGIGTTSPSEMLHLQGTGDVKILLEADTDNATETDNPEIIFSQDGGAVTGIAALTSNNTFWLANTFDDTTGALKLGTRNTARMTIKGDGNVGIGTDSPTTTLDVEGTVSYKHTAFTTAGPTDNVDVSDTTVLEVDTSSNNVTIGGFTGGVQGQIIHIVKIDTTGRLQLEHNETPLSGTSQKIYLTTGADELIVGYGGWTLYCNGTAWFSLSNPTGTADGG